MLAVMTLDYWQTQKHCSYVYVVNFEQVLVCTSNLMFGRPIWDKFSKITRVTYPKTCWNQTCDYWLMTPNQQTLCIETNIF